MPPKKIVLKDEEIIFTIGAVKQYWPEYPITPDMIRHPTRDFVLKFYSDCVENIDQKLTFATKVEPLPRPPGLEEEDFLYIRLSKIPSLMEANFMLGDLYKFDPFRLKNFIRILMHFLIFTETVVGKAADICKQVCDVRDKVEKNKEELKMLKEEKLEKQTLLTQEKAKNKKLKTEAELLAPEGEKYATLIEENDKKCKNKLTKVEELQKDLEDLQIEIQKLKKTESMLRDQVVTEKESNSLKNTRDSLINEEKNLEEIDLSKQLYEQKENIKLLRNCLRELKDLELSENIFKLSEARLQLKDEQQSLQRAINCQKANKRELKLMKDQLENEKLALENARKQLEENLRKTNENALLAKTNLTKEYKQISKKNNKKIDELKKEIEKREKDYKRLQTGFMEELKKICDIQDKALEKFRSFMKEANEKIHDIK